MRHALWILPSNRETYRIVGNAVERIDERRSSGIDTIPFVDGRGGPQPLRQTNHASPSTQDPSTKDAVMHNPTHAARGRPSAIVSLRSRSTSRLHRRQTQPQLPGDGWEG